MALSVLSLFICPFSKHLSNTFSVLAVMGACWGNGKTMIKTPGQILTLKELPMQRGSLHTATQRLGRGGLGGHPDMGGTWEKTAFPIMDCEFMHVRRITVNASRCPSWCLACSFNVVGAQSVPLEACQAVCKHFLCVSHEHFRGFYYFHLARRETKSQ